MGTSLGLIEKQKSETKTLIQEFSQPVQSSLDKLNTPNNPAPIHPGGKKLTKKHASTHPDP